VCYVQQCCVYGRNRQTVQCGTFRAVLCESVYIGIGFECVTYSSVVFMEGTDRQCSVARLVLYCVTVCILLLVLSVLRSAVLCLWREKTDSAVWEG